MLAFEYDDTFGPQGIISVVILEPEEDAVRIDTWLMSCRVLNRTVEAAVFDYVRTHIDGRRLVGEYIPTEKNGLVRDLFRSLGFRRAADHGGGAERWIYDDPTRPATPHFATIVAD